MLELVCWIFEYFKLPGGDWRSRGYSLITVLNLGLPLYRIHGQEIPYNERWATEMSALAARDK